jgi:hypothetical protein
VKTVQVKSHVIELPEGWEVVSEGRVQPGDRLYNRVLKRFEPALRAARGLGVGSRLCVIRAASAPRGQSNYPMLDAHSFTKGVKP